MNTIKYRALAKDATWRYGEYPHSAPEIYNTHYSLDVFWYHFLSHLRRETLGQFTGLLDKNGKEIYEGDIVRIYFGKNNPPHNYPVVWSEKEVGWRYLYREIDMLCYKLPHKFGKPNLEVIGTIYQNPELLKGD